MTTRGGLWDERDRRKYSPRVFKDPWGENLRKGEVIFQSSSLRTWTSAYLGLKGKVDFGRLENLETLSVFLFFKFFRTLSTVLVVTLIS